MTSSPVTSILANALLIRSTRQRDIGGCSATYKPVAIQDRNFKEIFQEWFSPVSFPFLFPFFFSPLFPHRKVTPQSSFGIWGNAVSFPSGENDLCSHQIRYMHGSNNYTKMCLRSSFSHKRMFYTFRAQGTCLVAANVVLFLSNEIQKLKQTWLFLDVLTYVTVWWWLIKFYVITCTFALYFKGVLTSKTHPLVADLCS